MAKKTSVVPKMYTFKFVGADKKGKRVGGVLSASDENAAKADLRRQGINPTSVKKKLGGGPRKKKIKAKDIAFFSRQIATMMKAGVPLIQSFDIIGRGQPNPRMQELVLTVKTDVESGLSLAEALRKHPNYFDDLTCSLVSAGEQSGTLDAMLDRIATYKEKTEALKSKIKKALFYPAAVVVVAVIVTIVLLIYVVPQFESLFKGFGADLPAFTKMVVNMSNWMQSYWFIVLLLFVCSGIAFTEAKKRSLKFRQFLDRLMLKLPIVGSILHKAIIARYARTLATTFAAGIPLLEALKSVAGATGNSVYSSAVEQIREDVSTGQQLQQLAMRSTGKFPIMVIQMVAIGEEAGSLDHMLGKIADFYEEEVSNLVDGLSSLLEPLIMVVLGVLVGGLVIAMYLPIFKLGAVV
jgi:type IV pilus assembly protein PilC